MATTPRGIGPVPDQLAALDPDGYLLQVRRFLLDLQAGRVVTLNGGDASGGTGTPTPAPPGPPGPPGSGTPYVPDLTAPPTPSGVSVTAGLDFVFIQTDAPTFSEGHGYDRTLVYFTTYGGSGPLPTFSSAVLGHEFVGQVGSFAGPPGSQYHVWLKWRTKDGVLSASPEGGANGHQVTTSKIGNVNLGPLIIEAGNLADGSVTGTKLAALAVDLTKFAAGIEPVGVVAALPNPVGYIGPKTILLTTDGKVYRYVAGAWTKAVDGVDLLANSVTTGSIAAGAINAAQIAAGAIRAEHILVAPKSQVLDPSFQSGAAFWSGFVRRLAKTDPAVPALCPVAFASEFNARNCIGLTGIDVVPGEQYRISVWANRGTGSGGAGIGAVYYIVDSSGTPLDVQALGASTATGWNRLTGVVTVAAGGANMQFGPWADRTTYTGQAWYADLAVEKVSGGELIVDGAITANKIAVNAIAIGTAAIQNGAIVNAMLGNATITDAKIASLSASKILAGSIAVGEYIQSSDFVTGVSGWRIGGNLAEIGTAYLRGTLTAGQIDTRGLDIKTLGGTVIFSSSQNLDVSRINAAFGGNLQYNSAFDAARDSWSLTGTNFIAPTSDGLNFSGVFVLSPAGAPGTSVFYTSQTGRNGTPNAYYEYSSSAVIPVVAGTRYILSAYTGAHRCDVYVFCRIFNAAGTLIQDGVALGTNSSEALGGSALSDFKRVVGVVDVAAGGTYAQVTFRKMDTNVGQPDSYLFITRIQFESVNPGATLPSSWTDSGTTDRTAVRGVNPINAGNISTYIANAAIQTAQIANLAVGSAQIDNASITNVKIGNAAVDTLQVAGGAITAPAASTLATSTALTGSNVNLLSLTLNPGSFAVPVWVHVDLIITCTTAVTGGSGSLVIPTFTAGLIGGAGGTFAKQLAINVQGMAVNEQKTITFSYYDTRGGLAGSRTYTVGVLQAIASVGQISLQIDSSIFAIGAKR